MFWLSDVDPFLHNKKNQKTSITRYVSDKPKKGDSLQVSVYENIGTVKIVHVENKPLEQFTEKDAEREGGFTLEEFKDFWSKRFGKWDSEQIVNIIHFERVS